MTVITEAKKTFTLKKYLIPILFTLTAFSGSALLFIVEPLIAKLLLPEFGGSSSVWTTSTFFFQLVMLLGYLYVHGSTRFGPKKQPFIQLALVLPALLFLPIALPLMENIPSQEPFTRLLLTMTVAIGLPFAVLSTTGPLIQKWYSWAGGPRSNDPYFLYAASNTGSFVGLLAYPFLVEPFFTLDEQRNIWSIGFVAFLILVAICGIFVFTRAKIDVIKAFDSIAEKLTKKRQVYWVFLAFLPASLQLGVTTHLTTDVASFPLLFIIPLGVYLATMIAAFVRKSTKKPKIAIYIAIGLSLVSMYFVFMPTGNILFDFVLFIGTLAAVSYAAHATLAADRPHPKYLTRYFVYISLGGAIGGAFNSLLAPFIFPTPLEFPIALALSALLIFAISTKVRDILAFSAILLFVPFVVNSFNQDGAIAQGRTFYGAWHVTENNGIRSFFHGTTLHGSQFTDPEKSKTATAYYAPGTPLFDIMQLKNEKEITVVGLGTGAIAAYGEQNQNMRFIEIDPSVADVALDENLFTYLSDSKSDIEVIVGDGRLEVEKLEDNSQDLIVLDAFSSDSIPVHLLTVEAFEEYVSKLNDDGALAVHISNRVFDLSPVVIQAANDLDYTVLGKVSEGDVEYAGSLANWLTLTNDPSKIEELKSAGWIELNDKEGLSWTDSHSSVLEAIDTDAYAFSGS